MPRTVGTVGVYNTIRTRLGKTFDFLYSCLAKNNNRIHTTMDAKSFGGGGEISLNDEKQGQDYFVLREL